MSFEPIPRVLVWTQQEQRHCPGTQHTGPDNIASISSYRIHPYQPDDDKMLLAESFDNGISIETVLRNLVQQARSEPVAKSCELFRVPGMECRVRVGKRRPNVSCDFPFTSVLTITVLVRMDPQLSPDEALALLRQPFERTHRYMHKTTKGRVVLNFVRESDAALWSLCPEHRWLTDWEVAPDRPEAERPKKVPVTWFF